MEDKRFKNVFKDPKFRKVPVRTKKVTVDKRFEHMFNDPKFKLKYTTDKRGRPVPRKDNEYLEKFYDKQSDSSDEEDVDEKDQSTEEKEDEEENNIRKQKAHTTDDQPDETNDDEGLPTEIKSKLHDSSVDYARGEGALYSDSSSEEESEEEDDNEDEDLVHDWGELDKDAAKTEEATSRLAICHMDWDRIRALDLMVLLHSFAPQGGSVLKVAIYPSDFGLERMKEEEVAGPKELIESSTARAENAGNQEGEDGDDYHREKLRKYQLNRLKYYYAVVDCNSVETAAKIYEECDGQEFESSATRLDLRFIPEGMTFDQKARDICDTLPDVSNYEPRIFLTSALQQAEVNLTWDETDPDRQIALQKFFQTSKGKKAPNFDDKDIKAFLATSSEDEDDDEGHERKVADCHDDDDDGIAKYRKLLSSITQAEEAEKRNKGEMEMEIKWDVGLQEKNEKMFRKKMEEKSELTTWEQHLAERREKRKAQKQQKKAAEETEEESEDDDIPSDVDMNDPYFQEEFKGLKLEKAEKKKKAASKDSSANTESSAGLELLLMDENADKQHFNFKSIVTDGLKSKKKKEKTKTPDTDFKIRVDDPRFSALFNNHEFNLDPSDPNFKKTEAMEVILAEKQKRRNRNENPYAEKQDQPKTKMSKVDDPELSRLVRSVKAKTSLQKKSKRN